MKQVFVKISVIISFTRERRGGKSLSALLVEELSSVLIAIVSPAVMMKLLLMLVWLSAVAVQPQNVECTGIYRRVKEFCCSRERASAQQTNQLVSQLSTVNSSTSSSWKTVHGCMLVRERKKERRARGTYNKSCNEGLPRLPRQS